MLYQLEQGESEKTILEAARREGYPLPDRIKNAPELTQGLQFYYLAFLELSTCRQIGFGPGSIPWLAIKQYADLHGLEGDDFHYFLTLIRSMDWVYLEHQASKIKKSASK